MLPDCPVISQAEGDISRTPVRLMCTQTVVIALHNLSSIDSLRIHPHVSAGSPSEHADLPGLRPLWRKADGQSHGRLPEIHACAPYAALTLTRNSSTALRSMPDCVSSSRALASTSDAALPVAAAAVVTPPIWAETSFDPAATD